MTDKQIIDRVNVKECKYYCNGKCERYEEFVEADYANYSVKCICEKENDLGTYDICDYQQLKRKEQECEELKEYKEDLTQRLCDMNAHKTFEIVELKQTLAEIKKLAGEYIEIYFPDYYDEGTENDVVTEFANKILQEINEVEE